MNIGIDHGYYAIKTRHFSFPAGITAYSHEPYTLQNTLEYGGKFFVCGTGRQPILRNKMENENYYLLTLAAIAKEIQQRGAKTECSVTIAAGLPLAGFGREKKSFREYLRPSSQPVSFKFEGIPYKVTIEDVKLFPQGYSALMIHPELLQNEPSVLLMDIGGWTVDLMRLDNNIPNAATCRSLELGMIRCIDEVKEQVRRDVGLSVTDAQVERVLAGKPCSMDEDARSIIQKQGRLYTERLLSAAMEAGFDLKAIPVVMLGGGAAVVKRNVAPPGRPVPGFCPAGRPGKRRRIRADFGAFVGRCGQGMSRPLFMFRPNLQNEDHRQAWALLQAVPEGQKSAFLVKAILNSARQDALESTLRRILREELQAVPSTPVRQPEEAIPPEMLGFLNTLMDDG